MIRKSNQNILLMLLLAVIFIGAFYLTAAIAGGPGDMPGGGGHFGHGGAFAQGGRIFVAPGAFKGGSGTASVQIDPNAVQGGRANSDSQSLSNSRSQAFGQVNISGDQTPADQRIQVENIPGLGGLFVSGSGFDCTINAGNSDVFMGGGVQVTGPILSRPCYLGFLARQQMNAASVAFSLNQTDQVRPSVVNASQLVNCGDETAFIASKATGYPCAVMPDRDLLDNYMGGMPRPIIKANPGYVPPPPPVAHHDYGPIPKSSDDNPGFDDLHKDKMLK